MAIKEQSKTTVDLEAIPALVEQVRETFDSGRTRSYEWRYRQLTAMERMLSEREQDIAKALQSDLGKPELEAFMTEIA